MNGNKPFLLKPAAKDYLWGGSRLKEEFGKTIDMYPLAETWECSTHPDGQSIVASGPDAGKTLGDLLRIHPEYLGTHSLKITDGKAELPILIKLIDAKVDLSVQVHPDDAYALTHEGSRGKVEMWYILEAKNDSEVIYGFNQAVDTDCIKRALAVGNIEKYLNHVPVHKNDLFFVAAGTVHAIGKGVIVAEIQENSNLTYRLYDYNRTDKRGYNRQLHVDKALDVMNMCSSAIPRQPLRVLRYRKGCAGELLMRCKFFQVDRLLLNTEMYRQMTSFQTGGNSFHSLLCIGGCGVLIGESYMLNFFKGDCIFVPADSIPLKLHGKAQLLDVSC